MVPVEETDDAEEADEESSSPWGISGKSVLKWSVSSSSSASLKLAGAGGIVAG